MTIGTISSTSTTLHVHVGVGSDVLDHIHDYIPAGVALMSDRDSWNEWGEAAQDGDPRHLVFPLRTTLDGLMLAVGSMLEHLDGVLEPIGSDGAVAVVTSSRDWSEQIFAFSPQGEKVAA